MSKAHGDTKMQRVRLLLLALLSFSAASLTPAAALTNGPVSTTIGSNTYSVFYSTIMFQDILANIGGIPNASASYSTSSPVFIDGLGSNPYFKLPWWNPSDSSAALTAAQQWYQASGWPRTDGFQCPNDSSAVTPYFVYGTGDGGARAFYVALDSDGYSISSNVLADAFVSFALAGASN